MTIEKVAARLKKMYLDPSQLTSGKSGVNIRFGSLSELLRRETVHDPMNDE